MLICVEVPCVSGREEETVLLCESCPKGVRQLPSTIATQNGSAISNLRGDRETRKMIEQGGASTSGLLGLEAN